jgi:hypothetical protein
VSICQRWNEHEIAAGARIVVFVTLVLLGPALIAKFVVGATWVQVGCAFLIWFLCLFVLLGGHGVSTDEQFGWTLIMSMFFGWLGVPVSALILRALHIPYRFLS